MKKVLLFSVALFAVLSMTFTSCVKKKFDTPPDMSSYDPNLPVNKTILQIKSLYFSAPVRIDSDWTVAGIVVADDRSGSFYKQIVVQDSTSGIVVLLGRSSGLYNDYPIGRKVYIKCKGLYVGAYGKFVQLGYTPDITNSLSDIPSALIANHIVKANTGNQVVPISVTINDLKTGTSINTNSLKWLGTLIRIDSTEFIQNDVNTPYAQDPNISSGTDKTIEDCAGKNLVVRMSGYSTYRNELIPAGKGSIVAIFSRYNNTPQLLIRDTFDINMRNVRCGGVVIQPADPITIDSLRKLYTGSDTSKIVTCPNVKVHGVVTSKLSDSNISRYNLILQDESGRGIVVYYSASYSYNLGDSLEIDVTGSQLIFYRGSLELKATTAKTKMIAPGKSVAPVVLTVAALNADLSKPVYNERLYESVLVKLNTCTIAGTPTTFNGNKSLTDGTGTIILYTRSNAAFSATPCPTVSGSYTGIATVYANPATNPVNQVSMRSFSDFQ